MNKNIVVVGSSNVDLIMKMNRLPEVGETVTNAVFMQVYGGKGANQAVAAARAGGDVTFVNCVGNDAYTPKMVENFKDDGIDTRYVFNVDKPSGHALVMIGTAGRNYLSVAPGANYDLTPELVDKSNEAILQAKIIVLQNEIPIHTTKYVVELAKKANIPVIWNFAPAQNHAIASKILVDILVVNETEASILSNVKVENKSSAEKAIHELIKLGHNFVVITLGADGVIYGDHQSTEFCPAFQVEAIDTTAAGDVFCGSFALAFVEGMEISDAIKFATASSALCVTKLGAQPSIPFRKEIDEFLNI